jgi:hypothetical protein
MDMQSRKQTPIGLFILLSISAHGIVLSLPDSPGSFEFAGPKIFAQVDLVEMNGRNDLRSGVKNERKSYNPDVIRRHGEVLNNANDVCKKEYSHHDEILPPDHHASPFQMGPDEAIENTGMDAKIEDVSSNRPKESGPIGSGNPLPTVLEKTQTTQKWNPGEIFAAKREKLSFRLIMFGLAVGSAVLEAVNDGNGIRISSAVNSNAVISTVYPVADYAETRLIAGRYILSRVRQREGSFTSDTGFTLDLQGKTVHWTDRQRNLFDTQKLPRDDLLDILAGFYSLRNQRLEVGVPVILQLYDSDKYAETTVEVLRREQVSIPGFREIEAIVVHPLIKTDSIFRGVSDILLWLSDDEFRVPVRFETSIPLGRVTAELISSEVEKGEKAEEAFSRR